MKAPETVGDILLPGTTTSAQKCRAQPHVPADCSHGLILACRLFLYLLAFLDIRVLR